MRDIDHHAEAVHLVDHVFAELGQPLLGVGDGRVVDVSGAVGPAIGIGPGERHVTHAERIVLPQQCERVLNGVPALNAHERGKLVLAVGKLYALRRRNKHYLVRMLGHLLLHRVDQHQRAPRILAFVKRGLHPDGKELRSQISLVDRLQVEIAAAQRIAHVEVFIDKALRGVGVGIDHDGGAVHGFRGRFGGHF